MDEEIIEMYGIAAAYFESAEYFDDRYKRLQDPNDPFNEESFRRERNHAMLLGHRLQFERSHWELRKSLLSS